MTPRASLVALTLLPALLTGCAERTESPALLVSVAISLQPAVRELAERHQAKIDGPEVLLNGGASGLLAQQALRGAPVDLFVSASPVELDRLESSGLLAAASRRTIAGNRIVILVPAGQVPPEHPQDLLDERFSRIVMGNPRTAPVGRYAAAALDRLGLSESLRPRMVLAENARQALEYVARGEVDAGLLYRSDAAILPGRVVPGPEFPPDPAAPIEYQAALLAAASDNEAARAFLDLLVSPQGQAVLSRHGFVPVAELP